MIKKINISLSLLLLADTALAKATHSMPWEAPLDKILSSLTGPVATGAGVIALTIAALTWAFGAGGEIVQRAAKIGVGLSIAFNAVSLVSSLFGVGSGSPI